MASPSAESIVLTDSLGREVRLRSPARRIVSLAPSNTEILFALGAGDWLIGRDTLSDYPSEAIKIPSVGSTWPKVNAEVIVALEPDLVLAAGVTSPDDVQALAELGLATYATGDAASLDDIYADILAVGRLAGLSAPAAKLVSELKARAETIAARTSRPPRRPRVFYEIDVTDPSKPWTAGPGSFVAQLLELAGGTNVGNSGREKYFQMSLEELLAQDPEVILLGSATYGGQTPSLVRARVGWQGLAAVKSGQIHAFDDNLVTRPGPRVVHGLETLARLIHPELFP